MDTNTQQYSYQEKTVVVTIMMADNVWIPTLVFPLVASQFL